MQVGNIQDGLKSQELLVLLLLPLQGGCDDDDGDNNVVLLPLLTHSNPARELTILQTSSMAAARSSKQAIVSWLRAWLQCL